MPRLISLQTFSSDKGNLTVFEKILPEGIKRVFYIYGVNQESRGGHRHKTAINALTCVNGSCKVYVHDGVAEHDFLLDTPDKCLILDPEDWHLMHNFTNEAVLLVLSNKHFDREDYIYEPYETTELINV
ncbi:MAG: FdtA/QdtA family cupin domain-containing protein [Spirosomaceae bacterium]|jgi:hypothetical protein|nr:FdtA/QdtA family cupin domain-containing protein [Spirosomataceae bacterium]